MDELEDQIYDDREENLTGMDKKNIKRIVKDYRKSKDKEKSCNKLSKAKLEFQNNSKLKKFL